MRILNSSPSEDPFAACTAACVCRHWRHTENNRHIANASILLSVPRARDPYSQLWWLRSVSHTLKTFKLKHGSSTSPPVRSFPPNLPCPAYITEQLWKQDTIHLHKGSFVSTKESTLRLRFCYQVSRECEVLEHQHHRLMAPALPQPGAHFPSGRTRGHCGGAAIGGADGL